MNRLAMMLLGATVLTAAPVFAQTPWIHVEVEESRDDDSQVKVNLPLSVVEIALEAAPSEIVSEGRIHLHHADKDIEVEDLRRMWNELRDSGDAELVSVKGRHNDVGIRRQGDLVTIEVTERHAHDGDREDKVHIQVPVAVVDALFSGDGEELNIRDAVRELKSRRGDVVRVDGRDTKVRIWIDEKD